MLDVDGAEYKRYMRSRRGKYCGANVLSHLVLKRKGGRDFTLSGRDLAGPKIKPLGKSGRDIFILPKFHGSNLLEAAIS